jgi:hypothetical protein
MYCAPTMLGHNAADSTLERAMHRRRNDLWLILILTAGQGALVLIVGSLTMGWWAGSGSEQPREEAGPGSELGIDAPPSEIPRGSIVSVTPTQSSGVATAVPTDPPPETSVPTEVVPSPTATPPLRQAPAPPASNPADFAGRWRITDTITEGEGAGQTYSFDVSLEQDGNALSGGNDGIQITGTVTGDTATVGYVQPAHGLQGTFVWTMTGDGVATGAFTSSYPNSGTSVLERLPQRPPGEVALPRLHLHRMGW